MTKEKAERNFAEVLRFTQDQVGELKAAEYLSCPNNVNAVVGRLRLKADAWFVNKVAGTAQLTVHKGTTLTENVFGHISAKNKLRLNYLRAARLDKELFG